jgi:transcriptional regulator with XRE-family HTH domain
MAARTDRYTTACARARLIATTTGREIRMARLGAGLSQGEAGAGVRMSHAQFGRIERAVLGELTVEQLARAAAAVGMELSVKLYPAGEPVRDRGQLRLLARVQSMMPPACRWRREVPLPAPGDLRAWDAVIDLEQQRMALEAETRLSDIQALDRRLSLKQRDGRMPVLLLVIADTRTNRAILAAHREALRPNFPLDGREIRAAFADGRLPDGNGLLVL